MSGSVQDTLKKAQQADFAEQKQLLAEVLAQTLPHEMLRNALAAAQDPLPTLWIGAGAVTQSLWNLLHGWPAENFLKDIDLMYFDANPSWDAENEQIQHIQRLTAHLPWPLDIKNVGRIHKWFHQRFGGQPLPPFQNIMESVKTWPFTASAIAIQIHPWHPPATQPWIAPFGFEDLLALRLRVNQGLASAEVCEEKAKRWQKHWPQLTLFKDSQLP
jgi:uncharacterized protein